jgi:hypothetical protein
MLLVGLDLKITTVHSTYVTQAEQLRKWLLTPFESNCRLCIGVALLSFLFPNPP